MLICLIRHGETPWNAEHRLQGRADIPLNDQGRLQAQRLAESLAGERWDVILSSPLLRAWQTATLIAGRLGLPEPLAVPELVERDYGEASGLTKAEASSRYADGIYPGAETPEEVQARCWPVLQQLADKFADQCVLVVAHGSVIKNVLLAASGGTIPSTDLKNASSNLLQRTDDGHWQVRYYDRTV